MFSQPAIPNSHSSEQLAPRQPGRQTQLPVEALQQAVLGQRLEHSRSHLEPQRFSRGQTNLSQALPAKPGLDSLGAWSHWQTFGLIHLPFLQGLRQIGAHFLSQVSVQPLQQVGLSTSSQKILILVSTRFSVLTLVQGNIPQMEAYFSSYLIGTSTLSRRKHKLVIRARLFVHFNYSQGYLQLFSLDCDCFVTNILTCRICRRAAYDCIEHD